MNKIEKYFTVEQISEYKEVFTMFDEDGDGIITTKQFGTIMRSIGSNPTETQIKYLFDEYKVHYEGTIDFNQFLQMITHQCKDQYIDEVIFEACKQFDENGTGIITIDNFKRALKTLGDEITEDEITEIIQKTNQNDLINYIDVVKNLLFQ